MLNSDIIYKNEMYNKFLEMEIKLYFQELTKTTFFTGVATKKNVNGFIINTINIINSANENQKFNEDGFLEGYHISSVLLKNYKRNKLGKEFDWFERAERSTYHKNTSKTKTSNGYSHWYTFSERLRTIIAKANKRLQKCINFKKSNYKKYSGDHIYPFLPDNFIMDTDKFFRVSKSIVSNEINIFNNHLNKQGSILIAKIAYIDDEYVYFKNDTKTDDAWGDCLDGKGRKYSVLGLLNKEMRNRILNGYVELDIDCSIQSIMGNLFGLNTKKNKTMSLNKKKFPEFNKLFKDKQKYRDHFKKSFKVNDKTAKAIITALTLSPSSKVLFNNCNQKNGNNTAKRKAIAKKCYIPFVNESKQIRREILDRFYYQNTDENFNYKIGNLTIKDIPELVDEAIRINDIKTKKDGRGTCKEDRILFRIYELVENQVRSCMIEYLDKCGVNEIYQIHDCVIFERKSEKSINVKDVVDYVSGKLNINIKLTAAIL